MGSKRTHTNAYHPKASGMGERFHPSTKSTLRPMLNLFDLLEHLPSVLLGIRPVVMQNIQFSSAEMVYRLKLLKQIFFQTPQNAMDHVSFVSLLSAGILKLPYNSPLAQYSKSTYVPTLVNMFLYATLQSHIFCSHLMEEPPRSSVATQVFYCVC